MLSLNHFDNSNKETQVISVKRFDLRVLGYDDIEHWLSASSDHLYIGRSMIHNIKGTTGTKWTNPFESEYYGKEEILDKYEKYVRNTPELMESLIELKGKVLGCWCHPEMCHGDILVKLLREKSAADSKNSENCTQFKLD